MGKLSPTAQRPAILDRPAPDVLESGELGWIVTVYNNDTNTYQEVILILMLATHCEAEEAYIEAWEIDHYGSCVVHRASEEECGCVAEVISTIGIHVEATKS